MQQVVKIGHRYFAIPKALDLAERIAAQTNLRGNWQKVMTHNRTARIITNTKR